MSPTNPCHFCVPAARTSPSQPSTPRPCKSLPIPPTRERVPRTARGTHCSAPPTCHLSLPPSLSLAGSLSLTLCLSYILAARQSLHPWPYTCFQDLEICEGTHLQSSALPLNPKRLVVRTHIQSSALPLNPKRLVVCSRSVTGPRSRAAPHPSRAAETLLGPSPRLLEKRVRET